MPTVSKSRFVVAQHCHRRLWLETYRKDLLEDDVASSAVTWGNRIGELARLQRPGGFLIEHGDDFGQALTNTSAAMAGEGDVLLFEPAFSASGGAVRCDILERRQGQWTLTEVKGAGSAKDHHPLDLAFQTWVLRAAGVHVERSILQLVDTSYVHPGGDDYTGIFRSVDLTREVAELLPKVPEMLGVCDGVLRGPEPAMRVGAHCDKPWPCAFYDYCAQGEPEFPVSSTPVVNPEAARALAGHPYPRYFLDFETYGPAIPRWKGTRPYQHIPFQWSCHVQGRAGDVEHREFLDVTGADPVRPAAEALIDALGRSGPIFEYTDYEGRTIEGMIRSCPDLEAPLRAIRERLVDLHPVTKAAYYHRDMRGSWSIKAVLPTIAPDLDYANLGEVQDGNAAGEAYEVLADPATDPARRAALDRDLRAYCKRDTEGLMRLAGFLEGLRRVNAAPGQALNAVSSPLLPGGGG